MNRNDLFPYRSNRSLLNEFQRILEPWQSNFLSKDDVFATDWVPAVDIKDENDKFIIHADVPGVNAKDIDVQLENNILTIKGSRESQSKEEKNDFVHIERSKGTFMRRFSLPDTVNSENIQAKCKDGILEVVLHKTKETGSRKITVKES